MLLHSDRSVTGAFRTLHAHIYCVASLFVIVYDQANQIPRSTFHYGPTEWTFDLPSNALLKSIPFCSAISDGFEIVAFGADGFHSEYL